MGERREKIGGQGKGKGRVFPPLKFYFDP